MRTRTAILRSPGLPVLAAALLLASAPAVASADANSNSCPWADDASITAVEVETVPVDPCNPKVDLFSTVGAFTELTFGAGGVPEIPAGFFTPDSLPWAGAVPLSGFPLDPGGGEADTAILRSGSPQAGGNGYPALSAPVRAQLSAMTLSSTTTIEVDSGTGDSSSWLVAVGLSGAQPQGTMVARFDSPDGGAFDAVLPVVPAVTFVSLDDFNAYQAGTLEAEDIRVRAIDFAAEGFAAIELNLNEVPFATTGAGSPDCGSFFPGFTPDGESVIISTGEPFEPVRHVLEPPPKPVKKCQYTHGSSTSSADPVCLPSCPAPKPPFARGLCVTTANCSTFQTRQVKCATQGWCAEIYVLTACS